MKKKKVFSENVENIVFLFTYFTIFFTKYKIHKFKYLVSKNF